MAHLDPSNFIYDEPEDKDKIVFAKGIYKFRIVEINSMTESKEARNPMIPIKFEFSRADGATTTVYENLVFIEAAKWKINQFLSCICGAGIKPGRKIDFEDADFLEWVGKQTGTARLKVERVQGKDYDRNSIENFIFSVTDAPKEKAAPTPEPEAAEDDDIPF
jgi:hypothetical protein